MKSFEGDSPAAAVKEILGDRRELALVAFERTRMPIAVTDPNQPDNPIVLANQAFLDLTGYSAEEVLGRNCRLLQGPGTAPAHIDAVRRGLAADEHFTRVELLNYRKDGSSFWNALSISPVHDENGTIIYYFSSQEDVTAQRQAQEMEAVERLLLMEIDHRSMNALALIESLLSLTREHDIDRFTAAMRGRIGAISGAHRLLAQTRWSGASLDQIVADRMTGLRSQAIGPDVQLPAKLVQPLALVLHELAAQALNGLSCSGSDSAVQVRWELEEDGAKLALRWSQGWARSASEPNQALGLKLVIAIVERQLFGHASFQEDTDAFQADLVIPTD